MTTAETNTNGTTKPRSKEEKVAEKQRLMSAFKADWDQIAAAREVLAELEAKASVTAEPLVKGYGNGPHKLGDGQIVTFSRANHRIRFEVLDTNAIT